MDGSQKKAKPETHAKRLRFQKDNTLNQTYHERLKKQMGNHRNLNVNDAMRVQQACGHDIVIVLAISPSTVEIQYTSYGRDKTLCNMGKVFADRAFDLCVRMWDDASKQINAQKAGRHE